MSAVPQLASSDADPQETREWLEAFAGRPCSNEGPERAHVTFLSSLSEAGSSAPAFSLPYSAQYPLYQYHCGS
jgi:pyruvate dehydrogenase complex dehydrogenase (E1) component